MKALVYTANHQVTYRDEPDPLPADGSVVLRIDAVGICGSDMHAYHGHDPRRVPPMILGHEFAGTIVAGPGRGKRVTGNPIVACGVCDYCHEGRNNLCANRTMIGMQLPGAFAEHMAIPAAALVDIPQEMDARTAALTEPAATALHALNLSMRAMHRPVQEGRALVIGGGAIGMLCAILLKAYGCRDVRVAETNPLRRASVEKHADCAAFDPREGGARAPASGSTHFVVDAVGSVHTRKAALDAVRAGGTIMHIGLQDWASEIDMRKLTLAEVTLLGTYTYSTADLRAAVAALHGGTFGNLAWVEERPLAEGARAFEDLDLGRTAAAKIVLRPH
ncbi:MAG: alcohol dehydrogenase catalytic domain-containing protein [Burkholderiales bacterium]|nr:alcohol dehydrogenase catalytic domain-containing protein [Burkholderiales bacterium]